MERIIGGAEIKPTHSGIKTGSYNRKFSRAVWVMTYGDI